MSIRVLLGLFVLVGLAGSALAYEVYLNGQPYKGKVKSRAVQGATLQFDAQGNLFINASQLTPSAVGKVKEIKPAGPGVYLVVNNKMTGQYMVKASINGTKALVVRASQKQGVINVKHLVKEGPNTVDLVYYPDPDADPSQKGDAVDVIIGFGTDTKDGLVFKAVYGKQSHAAGMRGAEMRSLKFEVPKSE